MKSSSLSIKQPTTRAAGAVVVSDEKEEEELVTTPTRGKRCFHRRSSEDGFGENTKSSFRDRFTSLSRTSEDGESEYSGFGSERGKHHHHRPKTKESGKYAEPNEEERKRMEYLKEQLVKHEMQLPKTMTIAELGGEERTLLRFVRARTKGKELAWEMLRNTLKWRKKWHVDECLERSFLENEKLYDIVCSQNSFYVGHGKFGHPIYFDNVTNMPWKQILSEFDDVDTFLRTQIQTMEWQQEFVFKPASERVGYPITQVINIWNLRGMTLGLFTSEIKAVTKKAMQLSQDNYPESLYQSYIINAPTIFTVIWSIIKLFLDVKTRNKVHIMGHGKHVFEQLQKKLGPNSLLTAEMVQSKFKDIGVVERKLGFESAHKKSQDYIRKKLREKNQPFYPSHSVLEKRKEELEQFDEEEFFDASDEHWWTKSEKEIKEKCFSCFSCFTKKRVNELP
ncbi:unnamed protein product [Bathycoccus prasinos]